MENALTSAVVRQELIPLSEAAKWQAALQNIPHAFGHTWENCYAMHLTTGYPTYLYLLQSGDTKVVCPLAERVYRGFKDIVTPYGFSGFVSNTDFPDFQNYWLRFAAQAGYVCGYIGLNSVLLSEININLTEVVISNRLYVLDLRLPIQELYQNLNKGRKRQLKKFEERKQMYTLEKKGLKEFFLAQYHDFFSARGAASTYNFSIPTLSYLIDLNEIILIGHSENGEIKAVSIFAYTAHMGEYLFNVSLPGYENQAASLLWYGALLLKEKHVPYFNLGGGVKPGDSIASFKQRFGPLDVPLTCLKQVYQEAPYTALCEQAQVDPADKQSFFPPYWRVNSQQ
ncbi:hypothetical protein MTX78_24620 (plasmid) [Hymenobacter tibetensis]|uniref:BioF2-like acetyltransferase domain-containing protein n=1 Tax=Hymenobacter tibetensis TaxID=497967 RepID=A0ABY4D5J3_9BACT|nr:hypothetical protein [Hymenobacter tibetensis]UOG77602.1 hypothetical protein MTX78_24620 [Hymenobacter tibetensis]